MTPAIQKQIDIHTQPETEAAAMRRWMIAHGVPEDRVIAEKEAKIDALYIQIGAQRDAYNEKVEENTELKVYKATNEVKLCMRRGCADREPQSGY